MMNLDLPLDDIISKQRRAPRGRRGYGNKNVKPRRFSHEGKNFNGRWERGTQNQPSRPNESKKILVSNLSFAVNDDDIAELFSECGSVKKSYVNYDRSGRSHGTAEIIFYRREDAAAAIKRYNHVNLDGRPMKIEYVAINKSSEKRGFNRRPLTRPKNQYRDRRAFRKFKPEGGIQKSKNIRENRGVMTKESLDADLEAYKRAAESDAI